MFALQVKILKWIQLLADKKMAHLDNLPLKEIEKVVNKCDLSHG